MLVDLPKGWEKNHPHAKAFEEFDRSPDPIRYGQGMYGALFPYWIDHLIENQYPFEAMPFEGTFEERMAKMLRHIAEDLPHDFGVCDYPEQVIERWPQIAADPRPFIILFQHLRKEDEQDRGWRWHKNGKYIGVHEPQCEYLGDEPEIEQVYQFHIYEMKVSNND